MFCGTRAKTFYEHSDSVYLDLWGRACFEIDDSAARIKLTEAQLKDPKLWWKKLGDVLDHPELYRAYPDLKDTSIFLYHRTESSVQGELVRGVDIGKKTEWFDDGYMRVFRVGERTPEDIRETVLHETQHAIDLRDHSRRRHDPNHIFGGPEFEGIMSSERRRSHTTEDLLSSVDLIGKRIDQHNDLVKSGLVKGPTHFGYMDVVDRDTSLMAKQIAPTLKQYLTDGANPFRNLQNWQRHPDLPAYVDDLARDRLLTNGIARYLQTANADAAVQRAWGKELEYALDPREKTPLTHRPAVTSPLHSAARYAPIMPVHGHRASSRSSRLIW